MRAHELNEDFRDWFNKDKKDATGPQLMNYADIEMIQSVDRLARSETEDVYNLKSKHGKMKFVYVKYPNSYEFRIILPNSAVKSFKFKTASELHKIFYSIMDMLEKKNGT
jgi:hypothetical protein